MADRAIVVPSGATTNDARVEGSLARKAYGSIAPRACSIVMDFVAVPCLRRPSAKRAEAQVKNINAVLKRKI